MATGENIAACDASMSKSTRRQVRKIRRAATPLPNPSPVTASTICRIDDLPLRGKRPKKGQAGERTFDKSAFLYDADAGVFYCPMGKQLTRKSQRKTTQTLFTSCTALTKATVRRTRCERSGSKNSRNQSRRRIECFVHEAAKQTDTRRMQRGKICSTRSGDGAAVRDHQASLWRSRIPDSWFGDYRLLKLCGSLARASIP